MGKKAILSLDVLSRFKKGEIVSYKSLLAKGIISKRVKEEGVKILDRGKISKALKVKVSCSATAALKVKKAGGIVIE